MTVSSLGSAIPILASALNAAGTRAGVAARNIADAGTVGGKALSADAHATDPGVDVTVRLSTEDSDTTTGLIALMSASQDYRAAASALGSISRTEEKVLDTIG